MIDDYVKEERKKKARCHYISLHSPPRRIPTDQLSLVQQTRKQSTEVSHNLSQIPIYHQHALSSFPTMLKSSTWTNGRLADEEMEMDRQITCQENVPIKPRQSTSFSWRLQRLLISCNVGEATIDILPDDALLAIFLLCKDVPSDLSWWQPLVHVCRRWRHVIFASPQHLNLTLVCTARTPTWKLLDIWPPIPIALHFTPGCGGYDRDLRDNAAITATLKRPDRIPISNSRA